MEWFKEVFDTATSKIKNPVIGSIIFAFVALNWKTLFYLCFSKSTAIEKFAYFDLNTNWGTLLAGPMIIGILLSFFNPWLRLIALKVSKTPIQKSRLIQLDLAHERLVKKQSFEEARRKLSAELEIEMIEKAKRDQEILSIENQELREKLQAAIAEKRDDELSSQTRSEESEEIDLKAQHREKLENLKEMLKFYDERREISRTSNDFKAEDEFRKKSQNVIQEIEYYNDRINF